jgi:hypothetical protein
MRILRAVRRAAGLTRTADNQLDQTNALNNEVTA